MNLPKDLNLEPPRGPRGKLGGYAILARSLDKGRAEMNRSAGEFHFNCPLDNMLFDFKGVKGEDIMKLLQDAATDEDVVEWLNTHGSPKTSGEIAEWCAGVEAVRPFENPEKKEWFAGECEKLGLDPAETTLFEYMEEDDRQMALQPA